MTTVACGWEDARGEGRLQPGSSEAFDASEGRRCGVAGWPGDGHGPLVKRVRKRDHRWWADSDNEEYEPQPLDDRARILGRVVWWAHTD